MDQRPALERNSRLALLILVIVGLVASVGQVALGGVVRVTGSGLGCPDWPLCQGQLIPPFEVHALIEYSHRLSATFVGAVVLATTTYAWVRWRGNRWLLYSVTAALALVVFAAALGAVTVYAELEWWTVLIHLSLAEGVVAFMALALVGAWRGTDTTATTGRSAPRSPAFDLLVIGSAAGAFVVILSGSFMAGLGYGSSCGSWPLCGGELLPSSQPYLVHMGHRLVAAIVGALIAATAILACSSKTRGGRLALAAAAAISLFLLQSAIGAATIWTGFSAVLKASHLVAATLLWVSLVLVAALHFGARTDPGHKRGAIA